MNEIMDEKQMAIMKLMLDTVGAKYTTDLLGNIDQITMNLENLMEFIDLSFYVMEQNDVIKFTGSKEL